MSASYRDECWLREQYVEEKKTTREIASAVGCSKSTIQNWLKKHSIETRPSGCRPIEPLHRKSWLREQYEEKKKSAQEISDELGCSASAVEKWLKQHSIETREQSENTGRLGDSNWLYKKYQEESLSSREIADLLGCGKSTVQYWLKKHEIETRPPASAPGEQSPHYAGGGVTYGSGWNEAKRQVVRERDGFACQDASCSTTQTEHIEQYGQKLHVHHLRKARDIDDPEKRNAKENLITLCRDCHHRWEKIADAGLVPERGSK